MSWIMRSSTTATSAPRGVNGASRSLSMNRGRSTNGSAARIARLNRSTWPVCNTTPCACAAATSSSASSTVAAIGFSISTWRPRARAARRDRGVRRRGHHHRDGVRRIEQRLQRWGTPARPARGRRCARAPGYCRRSRRIARPGGRGAAERGDSRARRRRPRRSAAGGREGGSRDSHHSKFHSALAVAHEVEESPDFGDRRPFGIRALDRLREIQVRAEEQPVRALELADGLRRRSRCGASPTLLRPYSLIGLPTALTKGGTSRDTRVQPPMKRSVRCARTDGRPLRPTR